MNNEQKAAIEQIINSSLDQAEAHWRNGGYKIALEMRKSHAQDSRDFAINESLMLVFHLFMRVKPLLVSS